MACCICLGDKLVGEVSRLVVAEACIQALDLEFTEGQIYEINSVVVRIKFLSITVIKLCILVNNWNVKQ